MSDIGCECHARYGSLETEFLNGECMAVSTKLGFHFGRGLLFWSLYYRAA